ncbi:MAG: 7-carboxy-7-deazaguanine synthase QueE [Roseimicrobium sp.]
MRIAELFYSVQGEGSLVGVPSVFIRTSGCNLRCAWCDTPYASWEPEGADLSIEAIWDEVRRYPTRFCVVTGGEPMIAKGMRELLALLHDAGKHITIETAGTVPPEGIACDLASLSPKLRHATPDAALFGEAWRKRHEETRWQPDVVRAWCLGYAHQLKFVVSSECDLAEIEALLATLEISVLPENVLLMPQGRTVAELRALGPQVAEWCKARGWRYCTRLHVELYGNKRGT